MALPNPTSLGTANGSGSVSVTYTANSTLVVAVEVKTDTTSPTISNSGTALTFTQRVNKANISGNSLYIWTAVTPGSGATTSISISGPVAGDIGIIVAQFASVAATFVTATSANNTTDSVSVSVTPSSSNTVVAFGALYSVGSLGQITVTPPTGYTSLVNSTPTSQECMNCSYQQSPSSGSKTFQGANDTLGAVIIASILEFAPASTDSGTGSLTLSASGAAAGPDSATAALTFSGSLTVGAGSAPGIGSLDLSGSTAGIGGGTATGHIDFLGQGTPPVTAPRFRDSASHVAIDSTSCSVTIPATTASGDFAIFCASTNLAGSAITPPSGLTLIWAAADNSRYMGYMFLGPTDPGATKTFTVSPTATLIVGVSVYTNTSGFAVPFCIHDSNSFGEGSRTGNTNLLVVPSSYTLSDEMTVSLIAAQGNSFAATSGASASSAPTGFLLRVSASGADPIQFPGGVTIWDGVGANGTNFTAMSQSCNYTSATCTLAPALRTPITTLDSSIVNKPTYFYGESYLTNARVGGSGPNGNSAWVWYPPRLLDILSGSSTMHDPTAQPNILNNKGIAGAWAATTCNFAYGTFTTSTNGNPSAPETNVQAGTWTGLTHGGDIVVLDMIGDDILNSPGSPTQAITGCTNAVDSIVRLIRSSSVVQQTDASITYGGTWSSTSDTSAGGGSYTTTITPGATATITTTNSDIDVILLGTDNTAGGLGGTGATFSVTIDGNPFTTGTTHNQMTTPTSSPIKSFVQMAVPCRNMGAGTHTIVITHTGSSGATLSLDCYLVASTTPPRIIMPLVPLYGGATLTEFPGLATSDFSNFNAILTSVALRFPNKVQIWDPNPYWDQSTMINTTDNVHPLDFQTAMYARKLTEALNPVAASGSGSLSLGSNSVTAKATPTATGSLSLLAVENLQATGSLSLSSTASEQAPDTGAGALSLNSAANWFLSAADAVYLAGASSASAPNGATGAVSISGFWQNDHPGGVLDLEGSWHLPASTPGRITATDRATTQLTIKTDSVGRIVISETATDRIVGTLS